MEINISEIINSERNNAALILGSSKRMENFPFESFKGKIITIGDTIIRGKKLFKADYWVAANNEFPIPNIPFHLDLINEYKDTKFFFSDTAAFDTVWQKSRIYLDKIKSDWMVFDDRHFKKKPCSPRKQCCELISQNDNKRSLYEYFLNHFKSNLQPNRSGTVAEFAIMISMIMGFNPIFIQGIELPIKNKDYVYYPSETADDLMIRTRKYMSKKYFYFYLKNGSLFKKINYLKHLKKILFKISSLKKDTDIIDQNKIFNKPHGNNNNKTVFVDDMENIFENLYNFGAIAQKNGIQLININNKSNLKSVKTIKYLDSENLSRNFSRFFKS